MLAIYIIAMAATCFHFSYGIWLFAAKWGITPGDRARKRFGYVCAVFGIALCLMGLISIYAFVGNPAYANAPADVMPAQPAGIALPAPSPAPPNSTNPSQPGEVR
jgi:succinate dehydrogenase / fumarate reductase cytochrome b subunit